MQKHMVGYFPSTYYYLLKEIVFIVVGGVLLLLFCFVRQILTDQTGLKTIAILLPLHPECCDYRSVT